MEEKQLNDLQELMCGMWEDSETGFEEFKSCERMCQVLEKYGFDVQRNVCDMETAYIASMGSGKPVIAILAEYDALYGMSQEADVAVETPLKHTDKGHGCGHHLLGVGAVSTGLNLIEYLKDHQGTIRVIGCPAEESGSGKAYLARDGAFDDVDIALTWHPGKFNQVSSGSAQSCIQAYYRFYGKSSHAAAAPEIGRSALDACELMNVGVNYLREHMAGYERVHYAYTNVGGKSPNVVQAFAELKYLIRSNNNANVVKLYDRVANIAKGAAMMSGVECEVIFDEGLSNVIPNFTLENMLRGIFKNKKLPTYTKEELAYAQSFKDSFKDDPALGIKDVENAAEVKKYVMENPLCDIYVQTKPNDTVGMGSTDV
ncbi:MAG: amidohydrolase, partial [Erysipelotrichaceae bacterium]